MELIEYLFVTPWKLMQIPITVFGYTFTLVDLYLFAFVVGIVGLVMYLLSD